MAAISFWLSIYLRLGESMLFYSTDRMIQASILFTFICAVVFRFAGMYRGVWRYASINDLWTITKAVSIAILVFSFAMFIWTRLETLPRSLPLINWFVLMTLLGGPRFLFRLAKDRRFDLSPGVTHGQQVPVLLVGAGDGAELFIRALRRSNDAVYKPVAIVADNPGRVGREIHGVPVINTASNLPAAVKKLKSENISPQRLILTKDDMDGARIRELLEQSEALGMTLARLPQLTDFKDGAGDDVEVTPVALEDLLGRAQTPLDRDAMRRLVEGRKVLVTGAGGSIGSELVRQAAELGPASMILLDQSEFALYTIDMEIAGAYPELTRNAIIADVRDRDRMDQVVAETRPDLVFHAAALKHVPLVEDNLFEGMRTNSLGTINVANACVRHGVGAMVLVSTDKAVNPTSIMGVSKRMAEIYCQALDLDRAAAGNTRFVTVRFGNVLGSTGSVVPLFQKQLAAGGPLTVTHPDMTRYFMTLREAVELILQASALGSEGAPSSSGQDGKIFVLDMGDPVRIVDLARQMIRLAGLKPDVDVEIEIIGPRPGEKLFEEVLHESEALVPTACEGILLAAPRAADLAVIRDAAKNLQRACANADGSAVLATIREFVPEYQNNGGNDVEVATG